MRDTVIKEITALAARDKDVFLVTGDAGFGILDEYQRTTGDRFLNLGVAEQNMLSFAAGLALAGYKVYAYNIIPFLLYRAYEQVRNDICYQELPVTLVGIGSGVTYAPGGMTHYSAEDIAVARTLPNLEILSPCDPAEARACAAYARARRAPTYIRVSKVSDGPVHPAGAALPDIAAPLEIAPGTGVALLFHGSIGLEVKTALGLAKGRPLCLSVPMLRPLDTARLAERLRGCHTVITVEEHFAEGGLGSILAEWQAAGGPRFRLVRLGIRNEFIHAVKSTRGMREHYGIDAPAIAAAVDAAFAAGGGRAG